MRRGAHLEYAIVIVILGLVATCASVAFEQRIMESRRVRQEALR